MIKTPRSLRKCVGIFGDVNSGKSTLFNKILGTDTAIVSNVKGTTTDVVVKSMELIPYGPIVLLDTAGLNDDTSLGEKREEKTIDAIKRCNIALYVVDVKSYSIEKMDYMVGLFNEYKIPYIVVCSKKDELDRDNLKKAKDLQGILVSENDEISILELKNFLGNKLSKMDSTDDFLLKGLVEEGNSVIMVIPIDSEAPKGRIIAPQVRLIRECLDNNVISHVTTVDTLAKTIEMTSSNLVVTDSQAFKEVSDIVNGRLPLTSYSILLAKEKGFLDHSVEGTKIIKNLRDSDKILILESCTHTKNHEDIGSVKIPKLLRKITGKDLDFVFKNGRDFKIEDDYKLIIHCGGCMMSKKEIENRVIAIEKEKIPIINYGVFLAFANGILDKSIEMFKEI